MWPLPVKNSLIATAFYGGILITSIIMNSVEVEALESSPESNSVLNTNDSKFQIENAFPNISVPSLVGMYQSPNDTTRWYVMSQTGKVYWFENRANTKQLNLFADLSGLVRHSGEQGLLGMAFDPDYQSNGRVFFSYVNKTGSSVIARLKHQGSLPLKTNKLIRILSLKQPASNHNGGQITFGPDGYLYISFGDGGGGGDTFGHGQNTQSFFGTILRIDVSGKGESYTVPADNPYAQSAKVLNEIYAYGLRNPWRWSFDLKTGELWVADVGQNRWEEVDLVQAGDNLGWPVMEGNHCYSSVNCDINGLNIPVAEYDHSEGDCSITGGYVYRGQSIPKLQGHFIFGDYCSGTIRSVERITEQTYQTHRLLESDQNISSFAQGTDGEILVLSLSGNIYRLVGGSVK